MEPNGTAKSETQPETVRDTWDVLQSLKRATPVGAEIVFTLNGWEHRYKRVDARAVGYSCNGWLCLSARKVGAQLTLDIPPKRTRK